MMKNRTGFTLVELLIVVAMIGLLAAAYTLVPEAQTLAFVPADAIGPALLATAALAVPLTSTKIRGLQAKKSAVVKQMRALNDAAGDNAFSAEDQTKFDALKAQRDNLDAAIAREAELIAEESQLGVAELPDGAVRVEARGEADPKRGFVSFGAFARAARAHPGFQGAGLAIDGQLITAAAPTTYGNEGSGADGGFLIPPEFASEIFTLSLLEDSYLPYCDNTVVSGNSMVFPKDETTPWGTDGVRAYWQGEAAAGTQTKPKFGTQALRLHKLMALVPVSDELYEDARALDSYLPALCARSIRWKTNEAIVNGSGSGQPQGFILSNAVVSVANGGASANTVTPLNLYQMLSQLPNAMSRRGPVWMIHPTVIPALGNMTLGNYPMFQAYAGPKPAIGDAPRWELLGLPVIPSQHCAALTSTGDVQLVDLSWYRVITKAGGLQTATSMHLYFDADAMAYRVVFRVDGRSKIAAPISQATGSTKLSPFLKLAGR